MIEDRRIRGEPGHRKLVDVALQRAAVQQLAGDVVEPEALAEIVQLSWSVSSCHLQAGCRHARRRSQSRQVIVEQVADALDRHIGRRQGGNHNVDRKRSAENASFRTPATLEALGDPVTYSQSSTSIVKSLRLELHTLVAGAFRRKMSIEKSVNFLQPGGTFSCGRSGIRAARDLLHSAGHFPGISLSQELRPTEVVSAPTRAKRECSSLLRLSHVAPLAQFLDLN